MSWSLKRTKQCAKCPWRVDVDPHDIPNYCEEGHYALKDTIAEKFDIRTLFEKKPSAMACHETDDAHCIGWLMNQVGTGNNIGLRFRMTKCDNTGDIEIVGDQHETFEGTLPVRNRQTGD